MSYHSERRRKLVAAGLCRDCGKLRGRDGSQCNDCREVDRARCAKRTATYRIWVNMLTRCRNPNVPAFANYGGRGIRVCERWLVYANFLADMGDRPSGCTIERLDNDGNYEPGNCAWRTPRDQANNRRSNVVLEWAGRRQTVAEWARETGMPYGRLQRRLALGWTIERALSAPTKMVRHAS